jgi:uncharacterized protein DUF1329
VRRSRPCSRLLLALSWLAFAPVARAIELPPEHACPTFAGLHDARQDAAPARVFEGMVLTRDDALRLAPLLPVEVWRHRDVFFHDGMRMVIGACHRRYLPPRAYRAATERFAGRAALDGDGNLAGYTAGQPFPAASIDPAAPDAGARWAWNVELRHRGAGPSGRFRIADLPSGDGDAQISAGSWFQLQLAHRADLIASDYREADAGSAAWIAGGRFALPASARGVAWQQTRPLATAQQSTAPDEVFVYVPSLAKARRAATTWVDGLFLPRYRVASVEPTVIPTAGLGRGAGGGVASVGASVAVTEHLARGFTGLAIRPNAYVWRVLGVREVLAPLNAARGGFPEDPQRNFGPSGLSLGDDRWDVRQAIAIQGALRERGRGDDWLTLYVDTETAQPLYVITERRGERKRVGVGILLHRWSGDQLGYPAWPDGEPAAVFDPAAAVFFDERDGSGWRRESYDARSLPLPPEELRYRRSSAFLERGR